MAKKSFADTLATPAANPALQFINQEAKPDRQAPEAPQKVKSNSAPEGYKVNPMYIETKSRRLQLLVQPSLYEILKANATAEGNSVNDYVHTLLEAAVKKGE